MLEKYSYAITIILLISSIISPIIIAIINNTHQLNLKKLDIYDDAKRNALSQFIKSCEDYMLCGPHIPNQICSEYYASINNLYIYFDIQDDSVFKNLEDTLKKQNIIDSNHELTNIVVILSKQIKKQ